MMMRQDIARKVGITMTISMVRNANQNTTFCALICSQNKTMALLTKRIRARARVRARLC